MGSRDLSEWTAPVPLVGAELPAFPANAFPEPFASFVLAVAEETQTPADLTGMLVLSVLAAAAARRVVCVVRDGWEEPLSLWTVVALGSGNRKTAVLDRVTAPLHAFERAWITRAAPIHAAAQSERRTREAALRRMEDELAKLEARAAGEMPDLTLLRLNRDGLARELSESRFPSLPRLLAEDATPEVLASLLRDHGGRIAVFSDEGGPFEQMAGRYSANRAPNLEVYLKGDSASELRVDRVGRAPEHVTKAALTLGLAVQPGVLAGLASKPGFRDRGLLARFLYALPRGTVGRRKVSPAPVAHELACAYADRVCALLAGVEDVAASNDYAPLRLRMGRDSLRALLAFMEGLEPRLAEGADLHPMADWASKLTGKLVRIGAVFHLAQCESIEDACEHELGLRDLDAALSLAPYLIDHARAAFAEMDADPLGRDAKALLRVIRAKCWQAFSKRDAHHAMRGTLKLAAELDRPLALLVEYGYIRRSDPPEPSSRGGRPPSPTFEVHPLMYAQKTHNTQNPSSVGSARSVHSLGGRHLMRNLGEDHAAH